MCQLRNYKAGDEAEVFEIVKRALAEYGLSTNPQETDADLRDIQASYLSGGGTFRILESDGRIAGSYGLHPTTCQKCELRKMYLLPELKGRGLGKMMMEDALRLAKDMGFGEMTLETNSRLNEASGLYKKYGFTEFTPSHLSDRCDLAMRRTL
ncbi:GNAT family N-acetyltransferase [Verrucomicrobiota bacterium]